MYGEDYVAYKKVNDGIEVCCSIVKVLRSCQEDIFHPVGLACYNLTESHHHGGVHDEGIIQQCVDDFLHLLDLHR